MMKFAPLAYENSIKLKHDDYQVLGTWKHCQKSSVRNTMMTLFF